MNIFVLDVRPDVCARYHNNRHNIKMIVETAQLLSTAHWETGSEAPYKKTHINHPSSKWARESIYNYRWLVDLGLELCKEYTYRYGKIHKTQSKLEWLRNNEPNLPDTFLTPFALAMPDEYKDKNPVKAYRDYYIGEKLHLCQYKNRKIPNFLLTSL